MNIYPNPVKDQLTIESLGSEIQEIILYDIVGAEMLTAEISNGTKHLLNVSGLNKGAYIVKVRLDKGIEVTRKITLIK